MFSFSVHSHPVTDAAVLWTVPPPEDTCLLSKSMNISELIAGADHVSVLT
jgi:hypothetical protein